MPHLTPCKPNRSILDATNTSGSDISVLAKATLDRILRALCLGDSLRPAGTADYRRLRNRGHGRRISKSAKSHRQVESRHPRLRGQSGEGTDP
ncbi:MAG: hypothetical protein LZF86_40017 [Nitrospira sp.]|nr:MAG: hypothetical protein LZF86_40017 [Nitrospira sp.]